MLLIRFVFLSGFISLCTLLNAQPIQDAILFGLEDKNISRTISFLEENFNPKSANFKLLKDRADAYAVRLPNDNKSVYYAYLGEQYVKERKLREGYSYLKEARNLAEKSKSIVTLVFYSKYSKTFRVLQRTDSATVYALKMLSLSHELQMDSIELEALKSLGSLYYDASEYHRAIPIFKNIVSKPKSNKTTLRNTYNALALSYRNSAAYDSALFYFQPALQYTEKNDTIYTGLIYGNIGDTYFLMGNYDKALPYLLTELEYTSRKQITKIALDCMIRLTELYIHKRDLNRASYYQHQIGKYLNSPHATRPVKLAYFKMSIEYYKALSDYKQSLHFAEKYYQLKDSVDALKKSDLIAQMSAQYDFEQQRKEIHSLNERAAVQAAENKQKSIIIVAVLIILLLLLAMSFILYLNFRNKRNAYVIAKQHAEFVDQVNEELNVNLEKLEEKNKKIVELAESLKTSNDSKDKLFSIISHDLRNPIHSLKGLLNLVSKKQITHEEFLLFSEKLKTGVDYIDFTMNNLLEWARSQMEGIKNNPQNKELFGVVAESVNFLSADANRKSLVLENQVSKDLLVFIDVDQISLVIRNLISNAIKFSPEQRIVRVTSRPSDKEEYIIVSVTDQGVGMSDEKIEALLRKQEHITTSGTQGEKGSGLGIRLCKEMVEANKGEFWVESSQGQGTTFSFTLLKANPF